MDLSEIELNGVSAKWQRPIGDGSTITILAEELRRERTGFHGQLTILLNKMALAYDTFNLSRDDDRAGLQRSAFQQITDETVKDLYPKTELKHDIDMFCRLIPERWEKDRFAFDDCVAAEELPPLDFVLRPYVTRDSINIYFGPPGTGKSYVCDILGLNIAAGAGRDAMWKSALWPASDEPVLYVNLERSKVSMTRRQIMILRSLRIEGYPKMAFLHAAGTPLVELRSKLREWRKKHPRSTMILDSITRTGMGPLNEDSTANRTCDFLRNIGGTWIVIGHSPRNDSDHLFGSQMFDAAADVLVGMASEKQSREDRNVNGVSLQLTKGNDVHKGDQEIIAFEFTKPDSNGQSQLTGVRRAWSGEFPELEGKKKRSLAEKINDYLDSEGSATATKMAKDLNLDRANLYRFLSGPDYERNRSGKDVYYSRHRPQ